jgi:hypothetical protein
VGLDTCRWRPVDGVLDSPKSSLYNAPRFIALAILRGDAQVAQLVEHVTENHGVGGSIPPLGTIEITRQFAVLKRQDEAVFKVWPAPGQHHIEISLSGACADK